MATIANWNGHTFEISPSLIRGFTDMSIIGSCETTDKNSDKQKYVERKYGEGIQYSMTVSLNMLTGVTDVFGEAMAYVEEATEGACDYFYLGGEKLIPAKLMLTSAQVSEVVMMPGNGRTWISCNVDMTFKQGAKNDGSSGGSSGGAPGSAKASVKVTSTASSGLFTSLFDTATEKLNKVNSLIEQAGIKSANKLSGLDKATYLSHKSEIYKATRDAANTAAKKLATTGRSTGRAVEKVLPENNRALVAR